MKMEKKINTTTLSIMRLIVNVYAWFTQSFLLMIAVGAASTYWDITTISYWQSFFAVLVIKIVGDVFNHTSNMEKAFDTALTRSGYKVVTRR